MLRRFFHLFALVALILAGFTQGMGMSAAHEAPGCVKTCKTSDAFPDPCAMNAGSRPPSCPAPISSCGAEVRVKALAPAASNQDRKRLERRSEPGPWPSLPMEVRLARGRKASSPAVIPVALLLPRPTLERLAALGVFRI